MTLTLDIRLGPYEVTAQIGVGGMGEVYWFEELRRLMPTNLNRLFPALSPVPEIVPNTYRYSVIRHPTPSKERAESFNKM